MQVKYSYLDKQFAHIDPILEDIRKLVQSGDFTLGKELTEFEEGFARLCRTRHAIGVGTGTDAISLSLKAIGVKPGDEVITAANTFYATVGAIVSLGARPVFVDCNGLFVIDPDLIEKAITMKTKAIVPVHYTGHPADMPRILEIAKRHGLPVVEDACQAIGAEIDGKRAGSIGITGAFSLHPLKNLNVWGDGGVITTNDDAIADWLRKYRNHGLKNRDECEFWGINCRMDTIQAIVGNHLIGKTEEITEARIRNANYYDTHLATVKGITIPERRKNIRQVYHTYVILADDRDRLHSFLIKNSIEAKVHYPIPLHLQPPARNMGHREGDFPVSEKLTKRIITLPVHQHLETQELDYVIAKIREFYA